MWQVDFLTSWLAQTRTANIILESKQISEWVSEWISRQHTVSSRLYDIQSHVVIKKQFCFQYRLYTSHLGYAKTPMRGVCVCVGGCARDLSYRYKHDDTVYMMLRLSDNTAFAAMEIWFREILTRARHGVADWRRRRSRPANVDQASVRWSYRYDRSTAGCSRPSGTRL